MEILEIAYELYKLEWLQEFVTPQELFDARQEYYDYLIEQTKENEEWLSFDGWLVDMNGFYGRLYVGFDEFKDKEFGDEKYMKHLLSENQFEIWKLVRTFG